VPLNRGTSAWDAGRKWLLGVHIAPSVRWRPLELR
jgi:hypothetical protein